MRYLLFLFTSSYCIPPTARVKGLGCVEIHVSGGGGEGGTWLLIFVVFMVGAFPAKNVHYFYSIAIFVTEVAVVEVTAMVIVF